MPWPPNQLRTVVARPGTPLPSTQTVHERLFGGLKPGRPVVIPPNKLKLKKDKEKPVAYRLAWEKTKPPMIQRAEATMDTYMPPGLAPSALSYVNAKRRRNQGM
jgi:hypothetical protein